jgi:NitT/TauT family transport system permease protein
MIPQNAAKRLWFLWGGGSVAATPLQKHRSATLRVVGLVGVGLAWEGAARLLVSPVFPPLSQVVVALWGAVLSGVAVRHLVASLQHIALGFCLAAMVGCVLGVLMSQYTLVRVVLMPVVDSVRPVAALTLFPLLIIILGLGIWSKAFVIFWTAWPAMLLATLQSIRQVDQAVREAALLDGAGRWHMLAHIVLPLASPGIMTGLRIGMGGGWISLVSAEMLGASEGLGYMVLSSSQTFQFATMYAAIIIIAITGLLMNSILALVQQMLEVKLCALPSG